MNQNQALSEAINNSRALYSVKKFVSRHSSYLTMGGFRDLLFNRHRNGLGASGAVVQLGRKLVIDEELFFQWLRTQQASQPTNQ